MPLIACHHCGRMLPAERLHCETAIVSSDSGAEIIATGRNFIARCPEHGETRAQIIGNHSTLLRAQWHKRLSSAQRGRLFAALTKPEIKRFLLVSRGWAYPSNEEEERWRSLAMSGDDS